MSAVHAILLAPAKEYREALISDGPCESRAPLAYRATLPDQVSQWWPLPRNSPWEWGGALVLAWDGKPHPDGVFRAWLVWNPDDDPQDGPGLFDALHLDMTDVLELARSLERCGVGRVVLLDADGREVSP